MGVADPRLWDEVRARAHRAASRGPSASPPLTVGVESPDRVLVLRRVTLADRALARLRAAALDREIAAGVPAERDVALALHARRLIAPRTRRQLARSLRRVIALPQRPSARGLPVQCPHISECRTDLLALAVRLERTRAVEARGVALARLLLTDGAGPLHFDQGAERLRSAAHAAAAALVPTAAAGDGREGAAGG